MNFKRLSTGFNLNSWKMDVSPLLVRYSIEIWRCVHFLGFAFKWRMEAAICRYSTKLHFTGWIDRKRRKLGTIDGIHINITFGNVHRRCKQNFRKKKGSIACQQVIEKYVAVSWTRWDWWDGWCVHQSFDCLCPCFGRPFWQFSTTHWLANDSRSKQ